MYGVEKKLPSVISYKNIRCSLIVKCNWSVKRNIMLFLVALFLFLTLIPNSSQTKTTSKCIINIHPENITEDIHLACKTKVGYLLVLYNLSHIFLLSMKSTYDYLH